MSKFLNGFMKSAQFTIDPGLAGHAGGLISGYHTGRSAAGVSAHGLSRHGSKTKNEETARNVAKFVAPVGALAGLAAGAKHRHKLVGLAQKHISADHHMSELYRGIIPFLAGTAGGAAAGAGVGAVTSLRGRGGHTVPESEEPIKEANALGHAAELAGLGVLARPSIQKLRGKPVSEKSERVHELAGLGILAAPSAVELGRKILKR